ncbi:MAG: hypothetical protein CMI18_07805 [Opitutaceae bacterium]|nr:hypothetical protein [Opitutaceae bacterium]|tara:strand:+ start:2949 stop:3164 length:216 start_codon:yes stop_codon:yes gene_type:complete
MSQALAAALKEKYSSKDQHIKACYEKMFSLPPSKDELNDTLTFIKEHDEPPLAMVVLCLALFNLNEFIYID